MVFGNIEDVIFIQIVKAILLMTLYNYIKLIVNKKHCSISACQTIPEPIKSHALLSANIKFILLYVGNSIF